MRRAGEAALAAVVIAGAACSAAAEEPLPPPAAPTEAATAPADAASAVVLEVTTDGPLAPYLVGPDGRTLYLFTEDHPGLSHCDGACLASWPPLLLDGDDAPAGNGVSGDVGYIERPEGRQVTLNGLPLYYWSGDRQPGETAGQGVNGVWFVVTPSGEARAAEAASGAGDTSGGYAPEY